MAKRILICSSQDIKKMTKLRMTSLEVEGNILGSDSAEN